MKIDHPSSLQIPQLRQLWQEAFGDTDTFLDLFFSSAYDPQRCLCITQEETVVAAAYWFACGEYAYIYAVATAKSHRGQGLCHKLMAQIHTLLPKQGFQGAVLVPGDQALRQFYSQMGYADFGGIHRFSCQSGTAVAIKKIDAATFAQLRRRYLPEGGVIQEKENLAFLSQVAQFYTGADFLLTASMDGKILRGLELLGNADAAPGILAALGAENGQFQTPGHAPFAMWRSLGEKNCPTYLGFAFD